MIFKPITVKQCIEKIHNNTLYLPAIQRKLVWKKERIEDFFDSLLRGYPIGTFIWWELSRVIMKTYPFYKFLNNYHERDANSNELTQRNVYKANSFGILDGQQRLNSLFIGLTGTYTYKRKGKGKIALNKNYIESKLYINLFELDKPVEHEHREYDIRFLSEKEISNFDNNFLWFELGTVLSWNLQKNISKYYFEILNSLSTYNVAKPILKSIKRRFIFDRPLIESKIDIIRNKLISADTINYFTVVDRKIENVVNIFQRVNSGGLFLTKADLLFSRLVSEWPEGRELVEKVMNNLKMLEIRVDIEFIMRVCLTLCDLPVLYKEKTFSDKNVQIIKNNWPLIVDSLNKTAELLRTFGFTKGILRSKNAIIPIAYYLFKGGNTKKTQNRKHLRRYLIVSQVMNIFSGQGDNVLTKIRECLRKTIKTGSRISFELRHKDFNINQFYKIEFTGTKNFRISRSYIENKLLDAKKGPNALMLLTLLYPNIDYHKNVFEMDHIHPSSKFNEAYLRKFVKSKSKINKWIKTKDNLPNLQMLDEVINKEKLKTPLKDWLIKIEAKDKGSKRRFIKDNFLPVDVSYDVKYFELFYKKRRETISKKLKSVLL
jgi:uncharacterized protein with ParB-like and HNH nuclease domain